MEQTGGITQAQLAKLDAVGTGSAFVRAFPFVITAALVSGLPGADVGKVTTFATANPTQTSGSQSSVMTTGSTDVEADHQIFEAIVDLQGRLRSTQKDLDEDSKNILYANLWDLYE